MVLATFVNNDDTVLCITCVQASVQKKLQWSTNLDLAFISKECMTWKDATVKFAIHEARVHVVVDNNHSKICGHRLLCIFNTGC